jgi:hypothetical protein
MLQFVPYALRAKDVQIVIPTVNNLYNVVRELLLRIITRRDIDVTSLCSICLLCLVYVAGLGTGIPGSAIL